LNRLEVLFFDEPPAPPSIQTYRRLRLHASGPGLRRFRFRMRAVNVLDPHVCERGEFLSESSNSFPPAIVFFFCCFATKLWKNKRMFFSVLRFCPYLLNTLTDEVPCHAATFKPVAWRTFRSLSLSFYSFAAPPSSRRNLACPS